MNVNCPLIIVTSMQIVRIHLVVSLAHVYMDILEMGHTAVSYDIVILNFEVGLHIFLYKVAKMGVFI